MLYKSAICQSTILKWLTSQIFCAPPPLGCFWQLPLDLFLFDELYQRNSSTKIEISPGTLLPPLTQIGLRTVVYKLNVSNEKTVNYVLSGKCVFSNYNL